MLNCHFLPQEHIPRSNLLQWAPEAVQVETSLNASPRSAKCIFWQSEPKVPLHFQQDSEPETLLQKQPNQCVLQYGDSFLWNFTVLSVLHYCLDVFLLVTCHIVGVLIHDVNSFLSVLTCLPNMDFLLFILWFMIMNMNMNIL